MRPVLKLELRRRMPCTSYPFSIRNSARKEPSCPVMPVISAFFILFFGESIEFDFTGYDELNQHVQNNVYKENQRQAEDSCHCGS